MKSSKNRWTSYPIDESAIYYEIGYSVDNGLLLSLGDERLFFTDGRYELEAREAIRDGEIIVPMVYI